jgi:hypothetical protein
MTTTYVDPIVEYCRERGLNLTRDLYIDSCYPTGVPDPWTPEMEAELPPQLQWRDADEPPPKELRGYTYAQWAVHFITTDLARIDNAVRSGLIAGQDSAEIGRRVIGSMSKNGVDGVTEITRRQIAQLGRLALKAAKGK